jgi:hypothetical protein
VATEGEPPCRAPKATNPEAAGDGAGRIVDDRGGVDNSDSDCCGGSAGDQSRERQIRRPRVRATTGEEVKEGPRARVETSTTTPAGRTGPWWS